MKRNNQRIERHRIEGPHGCNSGAFLFVGPERIQLRVIASDGMGWDHVSVSTENRCPTWEEMCFIKDLFFESEEAVMQLHPPKSQYVNYHPHCLHMWRPQSQEEMDALKAEWSDEWDDSWKQQGAIPLPPKICVGPG